MESELLKTGELFEIDIGGKIDAVFIDGAALETAAHIAEHLPDIGDREFHALLLERIGKQSQRSFFNRAFARIRIGRLKVVGFLVLLGQGGAK